jgi:TRC40/GET3/ArsA family transport-energizing ATPase
VTRPAAGCRPPFYEFIGGKGGVGKTTCAAAVALRALAARRRTLVVSTDPAHSLGDALGRRLGARVMRVVTNRAALDALELDADHALTRWLRARRLSLRLIAERGTYLDHEDVERFLDLSFPGVGELGGLMELTRVAEAGRYETVVVDTAPTGHTLRLLSVPETLQRIAAVLGEMLAKHHFLLTRLSGRDRSDAADHLVAEIDGEARRLASLLRDPARCRFRWIVLPEMLAVEEARDAVRALEASAIAVGEILVNRVMRPREASLASGRRRLAAEREAIAAVRAAFPGRPVRLLPDLAEEPSGLAALRPFVRSLGARGRGRELLASAPGKRGTEPPGARGRGHPRPPGQDSLRRRASAFCSSPARAASGRRRARRRRRWRSARPSRATASSSCPRIRPTRWATSSSRAWTMRSGACRAVQRRFASGSSTPTGHSPRGAITTAPPWTTSSMRSARTPGSTSPSIGPWRETCSTWLRGASTGSARS